MSDAPAAPVNGDLPEKKAAPPAKKPPAKTVVAAPAFLVSSSPHLADGATTRRIMFEVIAAMAPLFVMALYYFRSYVLLVSIPCVLGCLAAEAFANWMRGKSQTSLSDGSAILTGLILAFSLPPALNPYMSFLGGAVAILLAKAVFGGLGQNLFNPAMVGRAFLMICFPAALGMWTEPGTLHMVGDPNVDGVTQATPLGVATEVAAAQSARIRAKELVAAAGTELERQDALETETTAIQNELEARSRLPHRWDRYIGNVPGCVGETSALAALIGGLWLVFRRVADWRQPVALLATVWLFAVIAHMAAPETYQSPYFHLSTGALMFGAFFIATDYVGAPVNPRGRLIFGAGVGLLVMIIRLFGAYPEGFMFAILIMNALTPIIERMTTPTPFGGHVTAA